MLEIRFIRSPAPKPWCITIIASQLSEDKDRRHLFMDFCFTFCFTLNKSLILIHWLHFLVTERVPISAGEYKMWKFTKVFLKSKSQNTDHKRVFYRLNWTSKNRETIVMQSIFRFIIQLHILHSSVLLEIQQPSNTDVLRKKEVDRKKIFLALNTVLHLKTNNQMALVFSSHLPLAHTPICSFMIPSVTRWCNFRRHNKRLFKKRHTIHIPKDSVYFFKCTVGLCNPCPYHSRGLSLTSYWWYKFEVVLHKNKAVLIYTNACFVNWVNHPVLK